MARPKLPSLADRGGRRRHAGLVLNLCTGDKSPLIRTLADPEVGAEPSASFCTLLLF